MTQNPSQTRILAAARSLFFKHGFEKVSTDMLAREAAVSKATIYRYFQNMTDLLGCVATAEVCRFRDANPPAVTSRAELQDGLTAFGTRLLTFLNDPETVAFACLIHEEARHAPDMGLTFYDAAFQQTLDDLARMFGQAKDCGALKTEFAPQEIAEDFIALLEGHGFKRAQLGLSGLPYPDVPSKVNRAVTTLLRAHG
ncbi:TetR/AcrR family transcriptional regulator [Loktanella sp. DSM 29012]|uniref:TetR/AcrR family transcriptional regulator n=1 Tax=Loktanella sp. DSM 29012 TaxID=1881056 RepID=UPI000B07A9D9|nr:TetR/AcrR family transcriptional regulator [Loktanella sp. DSM 29012]